MRQIVWNVSYNRIARLHHSNSMAIVRIVWLPYEEILDISYFLTLILTFSCCSFSTGNTGDEVIFLHYFVFANISKSVSEIQILLFPLR